MKGGDPKAPWRRRHRDQRRGRRLRGGTAALLLAWICGCAGTGAPPETAPGGTATGLWGGPADSTLGAAQLVPLAAAGFLRARLCPAPTDSGWVLEKGEPCAALRIDWGEPADPIETIAWDRLGDPVAAIEGRVAKRLEAWEEAGRPLGRIEFADFVADSLLELALRADPGPHVTVRDLHFSGARHTRASYLERQAGWDGPRPYRGGDWRAARGALLATELFASVEGPFLVWPGGGFAAGADSIAVDLLFRLREQQVNHVSALLGVSGREEGGLFGFVDLGLGNLFGTGRAARLLWRSQENSASRFELAWHEPFVWRLPLELDLSLTHVLEDTLFAETSWGVGLRWRPSSDWRIEIGWGGSRLVFGEQDLSGRRRRTSRFAVGRTVPGDSGAAWRSAGWRGQASVATISDGDGTVRRGQMEAREWFPWRGVSLRLAQDAALTAGSDRLLRGDAYLVGGAGSVRGTYEGAYRAFRYVVQRTEIGPRPATSGGARVYLLVDVGWLRAWRPLPTGVYGVRAENRFLWAAGLGLVVPSRAGDIQLDYAVPGGEPIWRGRIHFGLVSRF